jgi:hypothetical protein
MASGWALLQARQDPKANSLVKAVAEDFATAEGHAAARTSLQSRFPVSNLNEIGSLVDAKAPDDAAAFKNWLEQIAQRQRKQGPKAVS